MTKLWSCTIKAWIYQKAYKLFSEGKKPVQAAAIELNLREKQVNKFWKLKHMDKLHQLVSRFKNGNRTYLEIKSVAEQIINKLLVEQGALLTSAIMAVVQALRVNPDRYAIIFDNTKYGNNTNNEYIEALREVANSFLQ